MGHGNTSDAECDLENIKHPDKHPAMEEPAQAGKPHQVSHVCADYKYDAGDRCVPSSRTLRFSSAHPVECYWIDARNPEYGFKYHSQLSTSRYQPWLINKRHRLVRRM